MKFVIHNSLNMDLLKGSKNYQKFLYRINEYKQITDKNQAFGAIQSRVDSLYDDMKSKGDKQFYGYLHIGIISFALILSALSFMNGSFFPGVLLIISAVGFKYLYNQTLKTLILDTSKEQEEEEAQQAFDLKLYHKMQYLKSGIDVKTTRISLVRNAYMVIFPVIMYTSVSLFNLDNQISVLVSILLAFMLGGVFWFYYFKDELDELEYQEMELDTYIDDFVSHMEPQPLKESVYNPKEILDLEDDSDRESSNSLEENKPEKANEGPQLSLGL